MLPRSIMCCTLFLTVKKERAGGGWLESQKVGHFALRRASLPHFHIVHLTFQSIFHPLRRTPNSTQDQHLAFLISDPASFSHVISRCSGHVGVFQKLPVFFCFFFPVLQPHPQNFGDL